MADRGARTLGRAAAVLAAPLMAFVVVWLSIWALIGIAWLLRLVGI